MLHEPDAEAVGDFRVSASGGDGPTPSPNRRSCIALFVSAHARVGRQGGDAGRIALGIGQLEQGSPQAAACCWAEPARAIVPV
jgi:hypothetical protein